MEGFLAGSFRGRGETACLAFFFLTTRTEDPIFQLCPQLVGHKDIANAPKYSEINVKQSAFSCTKQQRMARENQVSLEAIC